MANHNTDIDDNCDLDNNKNEIPKLKALKWTWRDVYWSVVAKLIFMHVQFPYGLYLFLFGCKGYTFWFTYFYALSGGFGTSAGNHRLWSHRAFNANVAYKILVMLLATSVYQNDIIWWCLMHRLHHKYADTDSDPHNSRRGFFFSHFGWFMIKDRPEVLKNVESIDMTDLNQDSVLQFQRKYYHILTLFTVVIFPMLVPMLLWDESFWIALNVAVIYRYTVQLHCVCTVNSLAHLYGSQPYDKSYKARENKLVGFLTFGEGWHNYHHTFPFDYRASEYGCSKRYNLTKLFIDFFARIGWVYDLKTASSEMITKRRLRKGSSTYHNEHDTEMTIL